ncbi:zinc-binding alcohol dehydrogenase family protein [Streptomyces sp. NPDC058417]|uniref:quinone oxidoreductase family protein n=2 Tax=Streptomyces TaxID=1883 RepID=UPI003659B31D
MKAVRFDAYGGPEVLRYGDHPLPEVGRSDVLVRVLASCVTGWDLKLRSGVFPKLPGRRTWPLPMQPGRNAAGVVEAVGEDVRAFRPGDRVAGLVHPADPHSPLAIRGLGNLSTGVDYPGHTMFGGNAQYVSRPDTYWLPLPDTVGFQDAAAALWSYATSHRVLTDRLGARLGDCVLVTGASGGMGTATLDLARLMGVRTVAVTRSRAKEAFLRERGASEVLVLPRDDAPAAVRAAHDPLGLDGAVDYTGQHAMVRLGLDCLRPGGTMVVLAGEGSKEPLPVTTQDCIALELNLRGARASTVHDQRTVLRLLAEGGIRPAIHAVVPLSGIREAHVLLAKGEVTGRLIVDPWA